jgi:lysophospholipase
MAALHWEIKTINSPVDGTPIRYATAARRGNELKRFIVLVNGRTEWIEKYDYFPDRMEMPADCGFVTWDHRGQGASGGPRAFVATYEHYVADAVAVLGEAVGDRPYVIAAHSMGGLISITGVLERKIKPQALAISGPLLAMPSRPLPAVLMRPFVEFLTKIHLGAVTSGAAQHQRWPFKHNRLTHSLEMFRKIRNSPYKVPGATFGWAAASFAAIENIYRSDLLSTISVPILVMAGSKDVAVDPQGFEKWVGIAKQYSKAPVQLSIINGAKHELFAEAPPYIDETFRHMKTWFAPFLAGAT